MSPIEFIDILKNRRNGQIFILIEDNLVGRVQVISPNGETLSMPTNMFEEDSDVLEGDAILKELSQEQLDAYHKYQEELNKSVELETERRKEMIQKAKVQAQLPPPKPRSSTTRAKVVKQTRSPQAKQIIWSSTKLTFYRHRIEPLHLNHKFTIQVYDIGLYEMTREQFNQVFSDVILSSAYKQNGLFSYDDIPEKAQRFLKS
jgi:hypothetical protein